MDFPASFSGIGSLCGTLCGLTTATMALRFYVRHRQGAPLLIDDWSMFPAWVGSSASSKDRLTIGIQIFFVGCNAVVFSGEPKQFPPCKF